MEDRCQHRDETQRAQNYEGEIVCLDCGTVLYQEFDMPFVVDELQDVALRESLLDIFERAHIPIGILDLVIHKYNTLKSSNECKNESKKLLLAHAVNYILTKEGIPRGPLEMSMHFDVSPGALWKLERKLSYGDNLETVQTLSRFMAELQVPYHHLEEIADNVKEIELVSCAKPETVAACAIYTLQKKGVLSLALSKIANVCGTSEQSVRSLYKKLT